MPHIVWSISGISAGEEQPRMLIPGIEPGGSRVGQETKPALLINNAWGELRALADSGTTAEMQIIEVDLKLSQELDLTPGLILPVFRVYAAKTATAQLYNSLVVDQVFKFPGTIWVPRVVGLRLNLPAGTPTGFVAFIHLDYDAIDIPWMSHFIMWDFLDNVVDNERQF